MYNRLSNNNSNHSWLRLLVFSIIQYDNQVLLSYKFNCKYKYNHELIAGMPDNWLYVTEIAVGTPINQHNIYSLAWYA